VLISLCSKDATISTNSFKVLIIGLWVGVLTLCYHHRPFQKTSKPPLKIKWKNTDLESSKSFAIFWRKCGLYKAWAYTNSLHSESNLSVLLANIRLGWKWSTVTNTTANYDTQKNYGPKTFYVTGLWLHCWYHDFCATVVSATVTLMPFASKVSPFCHTKTKFLCNLT
jgi:hypothetical protein